jgi:hypothetical protein
MKKYIVYICLLFLTIFSFSCKAEENQTKILQKISLKTEKIQWQKIPTYGASYQQVWKAVNKVLTIYFFRLLSGKNGAAWQQRKKMGNSVTEWIQLEPNTLTIIVKITKNPVKLFLAMQKKKPENNKWIPGSLNIRDKNILYKIIEDIQFKIKE